MAFASPALKLSRVSGCVLIAWLVLMLSGFGVVYSSHQCRLLTGELEMLRQEKNSLEIVWGQNLLEASSASSPLKVESLALDALNMKAPVLDDIVFIQ